MWGGKDHKGREKENNQYKESGLSAWGRPSLSPQIGSDPGIITRDTKLALSQWPPGSCLISQRPRSIDHRGWFYNEVFYYWKLKKKENAEILLKILSLNPLFYIT